MVVSVHASIMPISGLREASTRRGLEFVIYFSDSENNALSPDNRAEVGWGGVAGDLGSTGGVCGGWPARRVGGLGRLSLKRSLSRKMRCPCKDPLYEVGGRVCRSEGGVALGGLPRQRSEGRPLLRLAEDTHRVAGFETQV